jgi:hypothetical protein
MKHVIAIGCGALVLLAGASASAAVAWTGDFETNDTSQWNYLLNPEIGGTPYIVVQGDVVAQGSYAVRIELHDDAIWAGNMLRRVELQHLPEASRTAEGFTNYVAWSIYLPDGLPEDPGQTIGYWESQNSYQQMMAFDVAGERVTFSTRRPENVVQWEGEGAATADAWHRIAMRVLWSTDPGVGEVDVWFDGELVVDQAPAQTLADDNPHFMQVGLLRGNFDFDDVPVIIIDHALEGDSLRDVAFDELPGEGGESSSGGEDSGSESGSAGSTTDAGEGSSGEPPDTTTSEGSGSTSTPTSGATSTSTGTDTDATPGDDEAADGCGCRSGHDRVPWLLLVVPLIARRGTRVRAPRRGP